MGLFSPRVQLAPWFMALLDQDEQEAVRAHEHAHARHRDPLRTWIAQLATDLQWPLPAAAARYADWSEALELARDEEARLHGADGAALASAIVRAARSRPARPTAAASLGADERLNERIQRLLNPSNVAHEVGHPGAPCRASLVLVGIGLAVSVAAGLLGGEHVVPLLTGGGG